MAPSFNVTKEVADGLVVHSNVTTDAIFTTEDKIKIVLMEEQRKLVSKNGWQTPLGVFLSLLLALITSDFRDILGINKDIFKGIVICIALLSIIRLAYEIIKCNKQKTSTIDEIIEKIRSSK